MRPTTSDDVSFRVTYGRGMDLVRVPPQARMLVHARNPGLPPCRRFAGRRLEPLHPPAA